jgi:hypothetical protein
MEVCIVGQQDPETLCGGHKKEMVYDHKTGTRGKLCFIRNANDLQSLVGLYVQ